MVHALHPGIAVAAGSACTQHPGRRTVRSPAGAVSVLRIHGEMGKDPGVYRQHVLLRELAEGGDSYYDIILRASEGDIETTHH